MATNDELLRECISVTVNLSDEVTAAAVGKAAFASSSSVFTATMELYGFKCSSSYIRELRFIFPGVDLTNVIAISTMQQTVVDLVSFGGDQDVEKDRCLEAFFAFAKPTCDELRSKGYFADYIDPCSGLPMITPDTQKVFDEVQSAQVLLGFPIMNTGCCKILLHPKWGSSVYPATFFTTAPLDELMKAIKKSN